eukprot:TRINITY_DN60003_c0_g1_i1.p1 TRINITY_DN60003_c0_g1~~TRINITY_DN60003_c0_g1_i1.p1  ORF type:complete len:630 (+),score=52.08 TRINITY_DN60003_c0_g1_i1:58-1947(+)
MPAPPTWYNVPGLPNSSIEGLPDRGVAICHDAKRMAEFCNRLRQTLEHCNCLGYPTLDNLDISKVSWSSASLSWLCGLLKDHRVSVKRFKAYRCELDDDAALVFVSWLKQLPADQIPEEIHLSHNHITCQVFFCLLDVLVDKKRQLRTYGAQRKPIWLRLQRNHIANFEELIQTEVEKGVCCISPSTGAPERVRSGAVVSMPHVGRATRFRWAGVSAPQDILGAALEFRDLKQLGVTASARLFDAFLLSHKRLAKAQYQPKVFSVKHGVPYFRPDGWWQFQVEPWHYGNNGHCTVPFEDISAWPVAYHGSTCENISSILRFGLRKPGELHWVKQAHGAAGAGAEGSLYVSPSLWIASHPVYSQLKQIGEDRYIQLVLKIKVRPGSYREQRNTLRGCHWEREIQIDPNIDNQDAKEWLLDRDTFKNCDAVITGVMLRELGRNADQKSFGDCPTLAQHPQGPEYAWTEHLQQQLVLGGFCAGSNQMALCACGKCGTAWLAQGGYCEEKAAKDKQAEEANLSNLLGEWYDNEDHSWYVVSRQPDHPTELDVHMYRLDGYPEPVGGRVKLQVIAAPFFKRWVITRGAHDQYFLDSSKLPGEAMWRHSFKARLRTRRWTRHDSQDRPPLKRARH